MLEWFPAGARTVDAHDDVVHIEGDLGHDDDLRPRRDAAVQGDVPAMPPHDLHDGNALVRGHRVAELVDDVETGIHRRIEPERIIGVLQIVVYRAGNSDRGHAVVLGQDLRAAERPVAADDDKPLDPVSGQRIHRLLLPLAGEHFQTARRPEHGAAPLHDIGDAAHLHGHEIVLNQPRITALDTVDLQAEIDGRPDHRADGRIHAGRVAAARQQADSFHNLILRPNDKNIRDCVTQGQTLR